MFHRFHKLPSCKHSSCCLCSEVSLSTLGSKVEAQQALDQLFSLSADTKHLLFPPTSSGAALEAGGADTRRFPQTVGTLWKFLAALGATWPVAWSAGRPRGPFGTVWKFTQNVWPHTVTYLTSPRRGLTLACELCRRWTSAELIPPGFSCVSLRHLLCSD